MFHLYIIAANAEGPVKIGFSKAPEKRLRQLQTGHAEPLTLFHTEEIGEKPRCTAFEKIVHRTNAHRKLRGEWFTMSVEEAIGAVSYAVIRYSEESMLEYRLKEGMLDLR